MHNLVNISGTIKNIKTYKNELSSFRKWISSSRGKKLPHATFEDITDFLEIKSTGRVCTHNLRISVLRHFYRHLFQQCKIGRNPCIGLKSVIRQQDLPSVLSESQVQILLDMPDIGTQAGLRNRAILELLYATGIRVSELTLRIPAIVTAHSKFIVTDKLLMLEG